MILWHLELIQVACGHLVELQETEGAITTSVKHQFFII